MGKKEKIISIVSAEYAGDGYKIKITFSDGKINVFDYRYLVMSKHEEFSQYRDIEKFKNFHIVEGNGEIAWGEDNEMILPLHTIYYKNTTGNMGRKPISPELKKKGVILYFRQQDIDRLGGLEKIQKICYETCQNML